MDSNNSTNAAAMDLMRRQLLTVQRDYHHLLAENAMLKEQNYQLSQSLNLVVSRLTQLGYRVEPPFDIGSQIKKVREVREETLRAAAAAAAGRSGLAGHQGSGGGSKAGGGDPSKHDHKLLLGGGDKDGVMLMGGGRDGGAGGGRGDGQSGIGGSLTSGGGAGADGGKSKASTGNAAGGGSSIAIAGGGGGANGGNNSANSSSRFRCVAELKEHKSHVQSAAFAPYFGEDTATGGAFAYLATGAFDSRINLWRIPSSQVMGAASASGGGGGGGPVKYSSVASIVNGHSRNVSALSWCVDYGGYLISSSFDGTSKVWNVEGSTGLKAQCPPAPAHTITAQGGAYMVANCALSGMTYACADSRNNSYIVDFRTPATMPSASGTLSSSSSPVAIPSSLIGAGSTASWAHGSRITTLCGDRQNAHLLITGYANGIIKVWDLRRGAQPLSSATANAAGSGGVSLAGGYEGLGASSGEFMGGVGGGAATPTPTDRVSMRLGSGAAVDSSSSPFPVVSEWRNDESNAPVWHVAMVPNASTSTGGASLQHNGGLHGGTGNGAMVSGGGGFYGGNNNGFHSVNAAASGYNSSLLSVSEDGMARVYSVYNNANGADGVNDTAGSSPVSLSTPSPGDVTASTSVGGGVAFRQALRTLIPGIHARGMPIKASLWLGATFSGKNPFVNGSMYNKSGTCGGDNNNNSSTTAAHGNAFDHDDDDDDDDGNGDASPDDTTIMMKGGAGGAGGGGKYYYDRSDAKIHESDLLIVGSATGNASVFDVTDPDEPVFLECLEGHKNLVTGVSVLPPSARWRRPLVATYSNDHTVRLYTSLGQL